MSVVLARGRRTFSGASNDRHPYPPGQHRRHSIGDNRGRDIDPTRTSGHRKRSRSHSTDSSSSLSSSSSSSIRSTASEPPEMPVPHLYEPSPNGTFGVGPSSKHEHGWDHNAEAGWRAPGIAGPSTAPPVPGMRGGLEGREPGPGHENRLTRHEQKRARKAEKRGVKYERRRMKRAVRFEKRAAKYERRQRRRELRAARRAEGRARRDDLWKLLIFSHGPRRETGES